MKRKTRTLKKPVRSEQVPATTAMLYEMEGRLTNRMDAGFESLRAEFKSEFKSEFNPLQSNVENLKSEFGILKSEVRDLRTDVGDLRSEVGDLKSEVGDLKSEFRNFRSDFGALKSEIGHLKSDFSGIKSELHRVALLVEEQNARNKYVMDGYAQLYELLVHRSSN